MQAKLAQAERGPPEPSGIPTEGEVLHQESGDHRLPGHGRVEERVRDLAETGAARRAVRQERGGQKRLDGGFSDVEH